VSWPQEKNLSNSVSLLEKSCPAGATACRRAPNELNKARLLGGGVTNSVSDGGECTLEVGTQSGNHADNHRRDQRHHQAVFHRGRTRLIFEKILDPFHVPLSSFVDLVVLFGFGFPWLISFLTFATGIHFRFLRLITSWLLTSIFLIRFLKLLNVNGICLKSR
jgi:uncharacterized membrane protein (DUF485 family)